MSITLKECECQQGRSKDICNGTALHESGRLLEEVHPGYTTHFRAQLGLAPIGEDQAEWTVKMRSRGLGDTIAKITHATGIHSIVSAVAGAIGVPCGCGQRQDTLNNLIPYGGR